MRAVIFDLDDTLYDLDAHRRRHLARAWQPWLTQLSHSAQQAVLDDAVQERIFFRDMPDFLWRHGVATPSEIDQLCADSRHTWFGDLQLDDGVTALLDNLKQRFRLGLLTNGPSWTQRAKIAQFALERWFDVMVVSEEFGVEKPDVAIFRHILTQLDVPATQAVMVGDNPEADIRGAHAAGMRAVWVRHPRQVYPTDVAPPWRQIARVCDLQL